MVCADGGNPDPTLTHGKDAKKAKEIELDGWDYPHHLAGRLFSVVVHGDVEGAENVRRSISDWLRFMDLCPAGRLPSSTATSATGSPMRRATRSSTRTRRSRRKCGTRRVRCSQGVKAKRAGKLVDAGQGLKAPRQK